MSDDFNSLMWRIYASVKWPSLFQIMACRLVGVKPLSEKNIYLKQCWNIVYWALRNKLQWNLNRNSYIFIHENTFENVIWKMMSILSQLHCVQQSIRHFEKKSSDISILSVNKKFFRWLDNMSDDFEQIIRHFANSSAMSDGPMSFREHCIMWLYCNGLINLGYHWLRC